jgi:hypothetical protein
MTLVDISGTNEGIQYLKYRINDLETNNKNKNNSDFYRGIN